MSKNENEIKPLDFELQKIQCEQLNNQMDNDIEANEHNLKNGLKKLLIIISPFLLSLIGFIAFNNLIFLFIGFSLMGITSIITLSEVFIKDFKNIKSLLGISNNKKGEDFYSEEYKDKLENIETRIETEQQKKYKEALEKQLKKKKIKLIRNDTKPNYLDKNETMMQIVREIEIYEYAYKLPPLEIKNEEWDVFFDITYDFFERKGIQSIFYESISKTERYTFAKALLNKNLKINIFDFINNLDYLENQMISKDEINILKQTINDNLPKAKIINFSDYLKK